MKGCGCQSGILRYFKPPYAKLFYAACCIHDDKYDIGGKETDRKKADKELFDNISKIINRGNYGIAKRAWLKIINYEYYVNVRIFGVFYFHYDKN